jgi:hypothetical protein
MGALAKADLPAVATDRVAHLRKTGLAKEGSPSSKPASRFSC